MLLVVEKTASESVLRDLGCYLFRCGPPKTGLDTGFNPKHT